MCTTSLSPSIAYGAPQRGAWWIARALLGTIVLASTWLVTAEDSSKSAARSRVDFYGDPLPENALSRIGTVRLRDMYLSPASLSPDGKAFAACGLHGGIHLVDVATGKIERTIEFERLDSSLLAWSPDGKTLAAWTWDLNSARVKDRKQRITVIDLENNSSRYTLELPALEPGGSEVLDFSANGAHLIACDGSTCRIFDVARGRAKTDFDIGRRAHVAYCRSTDTLAWAGKDSVIHFRGLKGRQEAGDWEPPGRAPAKDPFSERIITSLAFSGDGKTLAVAWGISNDSWSRVEPDAAHPYVAGEFEILLHDFPSGGHHKTLQGPRSQVTEMVFSADGAALASHERNHTRVWNVAEGAEMFFSPIEPSSPKFFSGDDQRLFLGGFAVDVLYLRTGAMSFEAHDSTIAHAALSADGRLLATSAPQSIRTWEAATGRPLAKLAVERRIYAGAVAFVDQGRLLATAHGDRVVLRDPRTLRPAERPVMDATDVKGVTRDKMGNALGGPPPLRPWADSARCSVNDLAAQASGQYIAVKYKGVNRLMRDETVARDVIAVYDATGTERMREIVPPAGEIETMDIATSAPVLAYSHKEGERRFATVVDLTKANDVWRSEVTAGFDARVSLPSDGKLLFLSLCQHRETLEEFQRRPIPDCKVQIWDIAARQVLKEVLPRGIPRTPDAISVHGELICTYSVQHRPTHAFVSLSQGATDLLRFTLPVSASGLYSISADEKRVVVGEGSGTSLLYYEISDLLQADHEDE